MIAIVDDEGRAAVDAPLETAVAIKGASGTGKSTVLRARFERVRVERSADTRFFAEHPNDLGMLALWTLEEGGNPVSIIDDIEAEWVFAECAQALLSLEWEEFISGSVDPEVPGLRSPDRFLSGAFRLFRKLRDAVISPSAFLEAALRGATSFYAKPPNFAHPELILATKDAYRDSLDVDTAELSRQHRREVDLAKVLEQLYETYVSQVQRTRRMTRRDAIAEAIDAIRTDRALAKRVRARATWLFIDDAQEATPGARQLIEAIYGPKLEGVTLAGDPGSATSTFRGARPQVMFDGIATTIELRRQHRTPLAIEIACRQLTRSHEKVDAKSVALAVDLHRAKNEIEEARYVAQAVSDRLKHGAATAKIALIFRSVGDVHSYEEALLDANIPAAVSGDLNIFSDRRALDALALLWNVWDPFRHAWLLRTLAGPAYALSHASLVTLCSEPPDAQEALFELDEEPAPTSRAGRWDPKRDLRLGWNVLRGEQDDALNPVARTRVQRFREQRARWVNDMNDVAFPQFVRRVWSEGLARDGAAGSARALAQTLLLRRLLGRLNAYANEHPGATLGDILEYAAAREASALESCEADGDERYVQILSIDAARGKEFDFVVIPDARAGSFPRWYVPDSFLFSPTHGMIPKDNVGEARAARTAKFSYYVFKMKTREAYNDEERRAFVYALRRAREGVLVTASGKATRGTTAPEFFEELRNARLPGSRYDEGSR